MAIVFIIIVIVILIFIFWGMKKDNKKMVEKWHQGKLSESLPKGGEENIRSFLKFFLIVVALIALMANFDTLSTSISESKDAFQEITRTKKEIHKRKTVISKNKSKLTKLTEKHQQLKKASGSAKQQNERLIKLTQEKNQIQNNHYSKIYGNEGDINISGSKIREAMDIAGESVSGYETAISHEGPWGELKKNGDIFACQLVGRYVMVAHFTDQNQFKHFYVVDMDTKRLISQKAYDEVLN